MTMGAIGTLPGQITTAFRYQDYMLLYTAGDKVEAVVDGAPPGPDGRLFTIEPNKVVKVPYEAGRFILEHLAYTGVVRVNEKQKEDGSGSEYDVATAKKESLIKFEEQDAKRWRDYVEYCITDKINQKKAVPATPDTIKAIIARRGYRLSDYGIAPVGEVQPVDAGILALQKQVADLTAKLNDALGEPVKKVK
jgi:hypothetical protein